MLNDKANLVKNITEESLKKAAESLDISPSKYKQAIDRFESMQNYLSNGEYPGSNEMPEIYLQGSFKLGTEIRPYKNCENADYDIDIVCRLGHDKNNTTAREIKKQVGDHLKNNGTYNKLLDAEGKRCWTLNYAEEDGIGFHMDILPSIKENESVFSELHGVRNSIAVTNKNKKLSIYNWTTSNPKDFSKWFYDKNRIAFDKAQNVQKALIFEQFQSENLFSSVNEIPDIHVKTPLQRSIQLLKRHRDIRFSNSENEKYKPISMIITVLSAQVYQNESTIIETLENLIRRLSIHSKQLHSTFEFSESLSESIYNLITRTPDGKWHIPNPTNIGENFADRWHEDNHARARAFFQWVEWVYEDFINIKEPLDESYFQKSLNLPQKGLIISSNSSQLMDFNVPQRQDPRSKWSLQLTQKVNISASYNKNGYMMHKDGSSNYVLRSGGIVERKKTICFKAKTSIPLPYSVYWQVVNTGKEASEAHCLRGDFYNSNGEATFELGSNIRLEPTKYRGNHWVECFIVKDGICLARSGEFVVRIV